VGFTPVDIGGRSSVDDDGWLKTRDKAFDVSLLRYIELSIVEQSIVKHKRPFSRRIKDFVSRITAQVKGEPLTE
jgi:hypothetical protein